MLTGIAKSNDTKILIGTYDKLQDDITLKIDCMCYYR